MISLGSGDGRKGLGLGFDVGEEMEEAELEEGEACYYQNDDDSTIDPDVALSYIDEKLQDVLGHFQKDFEGGVSAENLGAKFGGYGSFLPTHQRSPASSHPRTPPKVHNYSGPKSPKNLHLEGGHHSSLVQSNASVSLPAVKAPPVNDSLALSSHAEDSPSNFEVSTKSANPFDQKNLKVRIKVSSDNLLPRKNAEIYSGLGLDVSPSSSLDGSPMDSDGLSHEPLDAPYESPTSILQVITSSPVHGSLLLSPLPNDLIHLIEKAKLPRKVLQDKKRKTSEQYVISRDLKNENSKNDARNSIDVLLKKETDIDTLACEEIVYNALKLPLLSNSYCNVVDSAKGNATDIDTSNFTSKKKSKGSRNPGAKVSKSEGEDFRKDGYKDFFGEIKSEQGDDAKTSDEILTHSEAVIENGPLEFKGASRERSNVKKSERSASLEAYGRMASNILPLTGNGPTSSADGAVPPVVKEDWVCCDKCQKWRLLPLGTNPNSLPEKWLCSMLYWLPGFNRCSIPQEETTKAVITRYQVPAPAPAPAPVSQSSQHDHANGIQLGVSLADARSSDQNPKDLGLHVLPSGKKKQELEDVSNAKNQDGPQFSNSMKKNLKESVKSRSVNGESQSPSVNEKKKVLESHSGGGDSLNSRIKREAEQDSVGASKKIKIEDFDDSDEDRMSDHGGPILKVDRSTSTGLSMNDVAKDSKRQSKSSTGNPEDSMHTSEDGLLHTGKRDDRDAVKKRNGTNCYDTLIYTDSQENRDFMEETSENHHKRDKKATISKSPGEETDKKGTSMMDQKLRPDPGCTRSQRSLDAIGSLKRDTGSVSSSSKVSSSHKDKAKYQEVKGSPVESVSSSPLRISNPDNKFTSTGPKKQAGSSPRRCIDGKDETLTVTQRGPQETSVHGFEERALGHASSDKAKEFGPSDHLLNEERGNNNQYHASGSHSRKSGKSRSKDKSKSGRSDKGTLKRSDSFNESDAGRNKFQEKSAVNSDRVENSTVSKKDSTGKLFSESGKKEIQTNCGPYDDSDVKVDAISNQELKPELDHDGEKSSKRFPSDKTDRVRGKSHSLPPSGRVLNEPSRWPQSISVKENGTNALSVDASDGGDDPLKAPKQIKKAENQNGNQSKSKNPLPNVVKVKRDVDAPSPVRRDSSNQAASNAVKEAKDLKHLADRLKNSGSNAESTGIYFQAALKFLHGASLLESCNSESSKHGEMIQSIQMYSSTAKLCEFCAHEYEKSKDMAAAALAYKCMEVAYLRVIYSSHTGASRDRNELQTAMQIVPPGESPSSSASDIENLNHSATVEKAAAAALAKGITSPQVAGNHVIAARNRPNFVRLLNFAQDVNFAMEASRKSRIAFAAACPKLEEVKYKESISSVKKALDSNFQDVDGLLHMVRVAMEIINR